MPSGQLLLDVGVYLPDFLHFEVGEVYGQFILHRLAEGLLFDDLPHSYQVGRGQLLDQFGDVDQLLLFVVLFAFLLLPVVEVAAVPDVRYLAGHFIDSFLQQGQVVLELYLPRLLDVEEELLNHFADEEERGLFVGDCLGLVEDEHHPVFEGVDGVDVLLVLGLDLQHALVEANLLQVGGKQ